MADDWSRFEVEATVDAYLQMLDEELRGTPYNKSDARRRLLKMLDGRSEGAIERKHQNISAILIELGFPPIRGYKPLSNYQRLLYDIVRERLMEAPALAAAVRERVEQPIVEAPPTLRDLLGRLVNRPDAPEPPRWHHNRRRSPWSAADCELSGDGGSESSSRFGRRRVHATL